MISDFTSKALRRARLLAVAAATLAAFACGSSGPEMARVSGKVTYKGNPVPKGTVTFLPASPEGRNATAEIQPDGSYTLQTQDPGDGAMLGDYAVTVYSHDEPVLDYVPTKPVPKKILTPQKYEKPDTSGLKAKVVSGSNTFDFELTD
ncbi:hypothetical protein TA3x_000880 [Tundrisphaera sp. TA3]|uniref:hypothetical protein n=1 Tax=Tundrisphaera sp. TA3 TaxID=3435775 RepID=UPI003EBD1AA5